MEIKELVKSKDDLYTKLDILKEIVFKGKEEEGFIGDGKAIVTIPEFKMKHSFADQLYIRQMSMEPGRIVIGAIHNHLHVWFLLSGRLTIATKKGVEDYIAPCYVVSEAGTQRLIYAHEDSIFVNVHKNPTNNYNIEELENEIVSLNQRDYEKYAKKEN